MTILELDPAKVLKHFGKLPERGKVMKNFSTKRVAVSVKVKNLVIVGSNGEVVGKKWVESPIGEYTIRRGEKTETYRHPNTNMGLHDPSGDKVSYKWIHDEMYVWPVLALKPIGHNRWLVVCNPEYLQQSITWLKGNCSKSAYKPQPKTRKRHPQARRRPY